MVASKARKRGRKGAAVVKLGPSRVVYGDGKVPKLPCTVAFRAHHRGRILGAPEVAMRWLVIITVPSYRVHAVFLLPD